MAYQQEGQEEFRKIHNLRDQLRIFYRSPLGKAFLAYLSSERTARLDALVYTASRTIEHQYIDKGIVQGYDAVINLDDFLYSMEIKKEESNLEEFPSTRVDD